MESRRVGIDIRKKKEREEGKKVVRKIEGKEREERNAWHMNVLSLKSKNRNGIMRKYSFFTATFPKSLNRRRPRELEIKSLK